MFHHTLSALPTDVVSQVTHAIDRAPEDKLNTTLKSAVIRQLSGSQERRLQQLFSQTELGNRIPSKLLRHMRTLVGDANVDETILQHLWMRCLPSHMAACLDSCSDKCNPEELAENQIEFKNIMIDLRYSNWHNQNSVLLNLKIQTLGCKSPPSKCRRQRLRPHSRIDKPSNNNNPVYCYHRTYGDDAFIRRSTKPIHRETLTPVSKGSD